MEEWEDWRYLYRKFINASTSEPIRAEKEYEAYDQKIDLLSEISSNSIRYTDVNDIIQKMILLTFNHTHGQSLTHSEFLGNCEYITNTLVLKVQIYIII